MITSNINLGTNVFIDASSRVNNATIGSRCKIAAHVNIFGSKESPLVMGEDCYIGPYCMLEGYNGLVEIGSHVSFAQRITLISGSAPNASDRLQRIFPINKGAISIGNHSWIGAHCVIMPNVTLGKFCVVAANSFVNQSFPDYSVIGGSPARLIRTLTEGEIQILND